MIEIDIVPNLWSADFLQSFLVSWHGFLSFVAVATGVILVGRWAPMKGIDPDDIYSIAIWAIIGGVIGARVVHVIDNWNVLYADNPGQIFAIWNGGIGLWGGILGGFIGGAGYAALAKHPVGLIADLTAPALAFAQSIGRIGDIVNGEHCAKATDLFFGMQWTHSETAALSCANGYNNAVHPVILYEILWNTMSMAIVWALRGRIRPNGMLFALYMALYATGRFIISFFREDRIWAFGMQEAHYIALLVLAITLPILIVRARFQKKAPEDEVVAAPAVRGTRAERRRKARKVGL
ncbi:MAG: prolipoprotein diacylglyceryl transferase [SAR202 cluster bacterium]|nr:prolipoprotein diacylglyceryl transferase [SAR202 cluster bacterium]